MTEDISAFHRLAVTVFMLAVLTSSILSLTVTGQQFLNKWSDDFITKYQNSSSTLLGDLSNQRRVTAAVAYRFLEEAYELGEINSIEVIYADGTTVYDYKGLLEKAQKNVKMSITGKEAKKYDIKVEEVE